MTTADQGHDAARAALAAARLDAPGGSDHLLALVRATADRYVRAVLCWSGDDAPELVDAAVARAIRTLHRDLDPDELGAHVHDAVRHEAFRRQAGGAGRVPVRVAAVAALVLVVVGMAVVALLVAGSLSDDPASDPVAVLSTTSTHAVEGRVVDTSSAGTVLGGRGAVEVEVIADGETVTSTRTDASGRFEVTGLAPGTYEVRLDVPPGHRLRGAPDGRSTHVDVTGTSVAGLMLQLQRS